MNVGTIKIYMSMKIFECLKNHFLGNIAAYLCDNIDFYRLIDIIGEYDSFTGVPTDFDGDGCIFSIPCEDSVVAYKGKNDNVCDIYFRNIHVHTESDSKAKVIRIYLKRNGDCWILPKKGNSIDISNPTTLATEIYIWYDVDVFGVSRCYASRYVPGSWNQYVTKTLNDFEEYINDMTTKAKILKAYKK